MSYPISIPLRADLFHAIREHVGEGYFGDKAEAAINEAVSAWLAAQSAPTPCGKADAGSANTGVNAAAPHRGYQWKQLFLPEGTLLRTTFRGHSRYATVDGEHIVYAGRTLTPSAFANLHGCGQRNAWRAIWLRLPSAAGWSCAYEFRAEANRRE